MAIGPRLVTAISCVQQLYSAAGMARAPGNFMRFCQKSAEAQPVSVLSSRTPTIATTHNAEPYDHDPHPKMSNIQTTIAPYDQSVVCKKQLLSASELDQAIQSAAAAQKAWAKTAVEERVAIITKWMGILDSEKEALGKELSKRLTLARSAG